MSETQAIISNRREYPVPPQALEAEQSVLGCLLLDSRRWDDVAEVVDPDAPQIAVIQGRFCLAYQGGMCFTCSEQCPEPGAITTQQGIPTVHLDVCTGCGICHDLCPAPRNAILMIERKPEHGKAP